MRLLKYGAYSLSLAGGLMLAALAGCSSSSTTSPGTTPPGTTPPTVTRTPLALNKNASLRGVVKLAAGEKPDIEGMNKKLADLVKEKGAVDVCLMHAPPEDKDQQAWRVSANGEVANVFVYLQPTAANYIVTPEDNEVLKKAMAEKEKTLDQPFCAFEPHSLVVFQAYHDDKNADKKTGQLLHVKNSSITEHNKKGIGHNTKIPAIDFNQGLEPGKNVPFPQLKPSVTPYMVGCDAHPWMTANVLVMDNPCFAVSGKDGKFEIKGVPVGKVRLFVWHQEAGFINEGGKNGQEIELKDGENDKDFTVKAPK